MEIFFVSNVWLFYIIHLFWMYYSRNVFKNAKNKQKFEFWSNLEVTYVNEFLMCDNPFGSLDLEYGPMSQ